ncbi:DUF397 domain-containing protein [Kitasatospora sp. NPDC092286]|uniref:DUF397 domain-containing protein n=1 Tax=Kitasatospora sp. NPDC092286 TaxID=3364087 RepID=UPI0038021965
MTSHLIASALPTSWRRASANGGNENCVECGKLADTVAIRVSKDPHGPTHLHPAGVFGAFVAAVAAGRLVPTA